MKIPGFFCHNQFDRNSWVFMCMGFCFASEYWSR